MEASAEALRGFDDPIHAAQTCFRSALEALARPGTVHDTGHSRSAPGLSAAATALALTLVDQDTPVWLDDVSGAAADYLRFHCGSPLAKQPNLAAFAFAHTQGALPDPESFAQGTETDPHASTTLVITIDALGDGEPLQLAGPGIADRLTLNVRGLPAGLLAYWREAPNRFPRGLDVFLCSGDKLCALPRTTRIGT